MNVTGVIDWYADRKTFSSDCKVKYKDFPHNVNMRHSARQTMNNLVTRMIQDVV